ncbi:MAG: hypothetical protein LBP26_03865 [Clostridiales bacterium]|jgi:hypothetical protein|nr:hypothetical protein [Clostridiales bacterium]
MNAKKDINVKKEIFKCAIAAAGIIALVAGFIFFTRFTKSMEWSAGTARIPDGVIYFDQHRLLNDFAVAATVLTIVSFLASNFYIWFGTQQRVVIKYGTVCKCIVSALSCAAVVIAVVFIAAYTKADFMIYGYFKYGNRIGAPEAPIWLTAVAAVAFAVLSSVAANVYIWFGDRIFKPTPAPTVLQGAEPTDIFDEDRAANR